ncbi:hypothetical protein [Candidatus Laterigemmans baculatus]|uniref:hypothetical protein n=1 Tax=Candidatus Laterigemmans baculatus TaxID=2770505 RepID=UPI0013DC23D7|nr:hypothetical protein [Candidatus Laterigemmans baculatus]
MDLEFALAVLSRIVHVITAIVLVGGSIFTLLVLLPATRQLNQGRQLNEGRPLDEGSLAQLLPAVIGRWKRYVHLGIVLFLITGVYNYMLGIEAHPGDGPYHALMGIKMLLALVVFFLASALVGRSGKLEGIRRKRETWLTVLVLIALAIVSISGFLKIRGVPPSVTPEVAPEAIAEE